MHLLACSRPTGSLEAAPRTSLRADSEHERWEGFWSVKDGGYYARCVGVYGSEQWYCIADEETRASVTEARVLTLRPKHAKHVRTRMLLLRPSKGEGRYPILVGTSRRDARAGLRDGAGGVR